MLKAQNPNESESFIMNAQSRPQQSHEHPHRACPHMPTPTPAPVRAYPHIPAHAFA
jgi:hypothetical protein